MNGQADRHLSFPTSPAQGPCCKRESTRVPRALPGQDIDSWFELRSRAAGGADGDKAKEPTPPPPPPGAPGRGSPARPPPKAPPPPPSHRGSAEAMPSAPLSKSPGPLCVADSRIRALPGREASKPSAHPVGYPSILVSLSLYLSRSLICGMFQIPLYICEQPLCIAYTDRSEGFHREYLPGSTCTAASEILDCKCLQACAMT